MSEPEEVVVEAVHLATVTARAFWVHRSVPALRPRFDDVRRRVELFVATLFPAMPAIGAAEPPAPLPLLARLAGRADRARPAVALASSDGARLRLPPTVDSPPGEPAAAYYLLLALEQAARVARGTATHLPMGDWLIRDLYALAEAAAVDVQLVGLLPGLHSEFAAARAIAIVARPRAALTKRELAVEEILIALLEADPSEPPAVIAHCATPAESLAWARATAAKIATQPGHYRGAAPVPLWGTIAPPSDAQFAVAALDNAALEYDRSADDRPPRVEIMRRRPRVREAEENEDDAQPGIWMVRADDPQESVEDPLGMQRPMDHEQAPDAAELGDALADLHELRVVRTPEAAREVLVSEDPVPRAPAARSVGTAQRLAIIYPEWDHRMARYEPDGAVVRELQQDRTDAAWAERMLVDRAVLLRRVRRDFERLRPRREILRRQLDGADLDVDAWVTAAADACAATSPDERLYLADRHRRRDTAVILLVDVSASTDAWTSGLRRVIDVEREAVLIVSEALASLGDRHAIYGFRSEGARRVDLLRVKGFSEPPAAAVRARISGLEPDGYTRMGAAVRHATVLLAKERARNGLLLVLSDGRPNDVDVYEGRYGLEDTRQAFAEARAQKVHPFCVTVDRAAPAYASHVFGRGAHTMLRDPARLPQVLTDVLRRLLRH